MGLACGSAGKKILLQCRRPRFDPWVGKIPWGRDRLPTPVFWPGEFYGLYNPWGCKELDMTEKLSLLLSTWTFRLFLVLSHYKQLYNALRSISRNIIARTPILNYDKHWQTTL